MEGRRNYQQAERKRNLEAVARMLRENGGYLTIYPRMHDFQRFVAYNLGCSIKTASEYIETVRGASIFASQMEEKK